MMNSALRGVGVIDQNIQWLASAEMKAGSWWPEWQQWIATFDDGKVPAREPGAGKLKAIEDAPGAYVKVQAQ